MVTTKDKELVLKYVIDYDKNSIAGRGSVGTVYHPANFMHSFSGLSEQMVYACLLVLQDEKLIQVQFADFPESDNIHTIDLLPKGASYFATKELEKQKFYKSWRWNIMMSVISALSGWILPLVTLALTK